MSILQFKNPIKISKVEVDAIRQVAPSSQIAIPFAEEKVSAGFPSPAQDYSDKKLDLNQHLISNVHATFLIRVASLSMRDAGIDIDDELIVDRSLEARHNDIVIALIDNEFTLKRLVIAGDRCWLKAENPDFEDIHVSEYQYSMIWGVITSVIKRFR